MNVSFSDCLDELTVRRLFVFLKENLILDTLTDEFIVRNFFPDNESKEYVFGKKDKYYRDERFLKLLIKKKRCKEFVACMHDLPSYKHVLDKILKFQEDETKSALNGKCKRWVSSTCETRIYTRIHITAMLSSIVFLQL